MKITLHLSVTNTKILFYLLLKISVIETDETSCMASFIFSHFVNCVVQCVRTLSLSHLGSLKLFLTSTLLSCDTSLKIALGIFQYLTQQLGIT